MKRTASETMSVSCVRPWGSEIPTTDLSSSSSCPTASPETEIPQPPRFAVQRLVGDRWETITFDDLPEDHPYCGTPLLYQSRYVAEHVAKAYPNETVRVHEMGGAQ
jgi:hypothetical protein